MCVLTTLERVAGDWFGGAEQKARGKGGDCKTAGAAGVNLSGRSAPIPQESTKNNPKERVKGGEENGEYPPIGVCSDFATSPGRQQALRAKVRKSRAQQQVQSDRGTSLAAPSPQSGHVRVSPKPCTGTRGARW